MRRAVLLVMCLSLTACQSSRPRPDEPGVEQATRPLESWERRKVDAVEVPAPRPAVGRPALANWLRAVAVQAAAFALQQATRSGGDWRIAAAAVLVGVTAELLAQVPALWAGRDGG
jgi:hypothetical protein